MLDRVGEPGQQPLGGLVGLTRFSASSASSARLQASMLFANVVAVPACSGLLPVIVRAGGGGGASPSASSCGWYRSTAASVQPSKRSPSSASTAHSSHIGIHGWRHVVTATGNA